MFPANWLTDCLTQPPNSSGAGGSASRSIKNVKPPPPCTPRLAGLKWGRDKGLVWHTLRHEFCSRTAENTGDPVVAQELGRGAFEQEVTVGRLDWLRRRQKNHVPGLLLEMSCATMMTSRPRVRARLAMPDGAVNGVNARRNRRRRHKRARLD